MARIPEETIERIRNTADIYDVVAQYVDLKKKKAGITLAYVLFILRKHRLLV